MVPLRVARELREGGFDVDAMVEHPALRGLPDGEQLAHAAGDGRALVTYYAGDLIPLALARTAAGEEHCGLILLRSSRFPKADPAKLVDGLRAFLESPEPVAEVLHWLQ